MKALFVVMGAVEAAAGLALIVSPSTVSLLLLGSPLETAAASVIGRLAGLALFSLGVICWSASRAEVSRMSAKLLGAMLLYNLGAALILAYAGFEIGLSGPGLWLAIVAHLAMAAACFASGRNVLSTKYR